MQDILQRQNIQHTYQIDKVSDNEDKQAEDLFNQIQLSSGHRMEHQSDHHQQKSAKSELSKQRQQKPIISKRMKKHTLQLDSDNDNDSEKNMHAQIIQSKSGSKTKKDKKQRKLQKKKRKKLQKQKKHKKQKSKLKKIREQQNGNEANDKQNQKSNQWSGESSQSLGSDSDASEDSLLGNLNPKKKIKSAEKKQGFSLKELGNNAEVQYQNNENASDDSSYENKKKTKKTKPQKKEATKNHDLLKSLLQIGLCVGQEEGGNKGQQQFDNGIEQVLNMKGSKKKGPKITNKLFVDMDINQNQENFEPMPDKIELEVKVRTSTGPSAIASSFLNKTQKLKKVRGMQSQIQSEQFDKMISFKAKQSMVKLISKQELNEADDIQLDVKVPQFVKGKEQLNNSIFLKKISSIASQPANNKMPSPVKQVKKQKLKLNRFDFFKSMSDQLKAKKSRQVTHDVIKNSFKVTKLQEIDEMRKKNEEKRRKQALVGSDDDESYEANQQKASGGNDQKFEVMENKLGFMNFKVQIQKVAADIDISQNIKQQKPKELMNQQQDLLKQVEIRKTKSFNIEIKNTLSDKDYKKLLQLEQGQQDNVDVQQSEEAQNQQKQNPIQEQKQNEHKDEDDNFDEQQVHEDDIIGMDQEEDKQARDQNQIQSQSLKSANRVELEVDLEVSQFPSQEQQIEQQVEDENKKRQPINQQYQQYLNQLQQQGIKLKKTNNNKENYQHLENSQHQVQKNMQQSEARKQFRKLRKLANIIKQKKTVEMRVKRAGEFFEEEAEEGSDNQNHDDQVKKINYDQEQKQYDGIDLDAELEELIDNAVDINQQNQQLAFKKYMEDVKIRDREEIQRIMRGDFKRNKDIEPMMDEMQQDQKNRMQRMQQFEEYMKQKQIDEGKDMYMKAENESENIQNDNSDDAQDSENNSRNKIKQNKDNKNDEQQYEIVDELNQQNLKRYLDEGIADNFITTTVVKKKPKTELPESYQRSKKTQMRNVLKSKQWNPQSMIKLKKTSSHLNEMIMKNKKQIKPLVFPKNFSVITARK